MDKMVKILGPLVKFLSRGGLNYIYSEQDLEQELWCKILKILPKLKEVNSKDLFRLAKVILKNYICDIIDAQVLRKDTSIYAKVGDENLEQLIVKGLTDIRFPINYTPDPYKVLLDKSLMYFICNWTKNKNRITKQFIKAFIEEGDKPFKVGRKLGLNEPKIYKILNDLRSYLQTLGFTN